MGRLLAFVYGSIAYLIFLGVVIYSFIFIGDVAVPQSLGSLSLPFVLRTIDSGATGPLILAVVIDTLLLGLFGVQHSVMARESFKRWWKSIVPPVVERSTYVLFASLLLALLYWQWRPVQTVVWTVEQPIAHAMLTGLYWFGWAWLLVSTFLISHFDLFGLRQVYLNLIGKQPAPMAFKTPLLYRLVRHPLLVGFVILFWATPLMTVGHLLFALLASGYIFVGARLEERDLVRYFGAAYTKYQRQVFMFLPWPRKPTSA